MRKSEFNAYKHCGKCKRPLLDHPVDEDGNISQFGVKCPYPEREFEQDAIE